MANGRCRNHGGLSSGPKTPKGKAAVSKASKERYHRGGRDALKKGYEAWLETDGREELSRIAKRRWMIFKLLNDIQFLHTYAHACHGVKRLPKHFQHTPKNDL